jgi:hypothetical protein
MKPKSKAELLEHYATREPKAFHQFDGFLEQWGDSATRMVTGYMAPASLGNLCAGAGTGAACGC